MRTLSLLIVYLLLLALLPTVNSANESVGYYENLASISFIYAIERLDALSEEDRGKALAEMVFMAFRYFLEVSGDRIPPSKRVQKSINIFYTGVEEHYGEAVKNFSDPLVTDGYKKSFSLPENLKFPDEDYEDVVQAFLRFVNLKKDVTSEVCN